MVCELTVWISQNWNPACKCATEIKAKLQLISGSYNCWRQSMWLRRQDKDQLGLWLVDNSYVTQTVCWNAGLFDQQRATLLCWHFLAAIITHCSHLAAHIHSTCFFPCLLTFQEYLFQVWRHLGKAGGFSWCEMRPSHWDLTRGISDGCLEAWSFFFVQVATRHLFVSFSPFSLDGHSLSPSLNS